MGCIFCDIAAGKAPSAAVYQDADFVAFRDIKPVTPVHILIVPRQHIASLNEVTGEHSSLVGSMILVATHIARQEKLDHGGYRLVMNCGRQGGQAVPHLHVHLLGGRQLTPGMG
ncbi:MAG: histidine triad nucleotide-binding protein [Chloroflexota bacterium]